MAFVHYTVKKIVHGLGAIKEAANEVKNLKGSKAFIVTDPGLAKIGVQKPLEEALTAGGIEWKLYAEAQLEPSMDSIQHCTDEAKAFGADVIIGFGGGSALDTTKAASVLLSNEGPIDKYFGINLVPNPSLPCILIPTTSGTGSEMTNISVLADTKNGGKKGVVSEYMYADTVILDKRQGRGRDMFQGQGRLGTDGDAVAAPDAAGQSPVQDIHRPVGVASEDALRAYADAAPAPDAMILVEFKRNHRQSFGSVSERTPFPGGFPPFVS